MKGDFSRNTFRRQKHYTGVRMQQGRVQVDADWNEQLDIDAYRSRIAYRDIIGSCGGPLGVDADGNDLAGFKISATGASLHISAGRYYAHGILLENEVAAPLQAQPDLPDYDPDAVVEAGGAGVYLAYLDVWERHLTALEDAEMREVALGGPDTATRTKAVWQVKLERVGDPGAGLECGQFGQGWQPAGAASTGALAARAQESPPPQEPCEVPPGAGYRRLENQLYRVEIHQAGGVGTATFKWSRENGSVVTRWESQDGNNLVASSPGRDRMLGFGAGDWVELTDDTRELHGRPGVLVRLSQVDGAVFTIDPSTIQDPDDPTAAAVNRADFPRNPKIRRWESTDGAQVVPGPAGGWIELEDGVEIRFGAGQYQTGDYWTVPARTAVGDVLWPQDAAGDPVSEPRHGIHHGYCPLALAAFDGETWTDIRDCRKLFPPLTELPTAGASCCEVTVGDGVRSIGDFNRIQDAVNAVADGGTICLLPGEHRLRATVHIAAPYIAIHGCGRETLVVAAENQPAFAISDAARGVHLASLHVHATAPEGAVLIGNSADVRVEDCTILNRGQVRQPDERRRRDDLRLREAAAGVSRGKLELPGPALVIGECVEVSITGNLLLGLPALILQGEGLRVLENRLYGGGAWLWDGCEQVLVRGNHISGGSGPGVILGGLPPRRQPSRRAAGVTQVVIASNHIEGMGGSGISTVTALDEQPQLGEIEDLVVSDNSITGCGGQGIDETFDRLAVGGVVLRHVSGARIFDNSIVGNGLPATDAARAATSACGVFTYLCQEVEIFGNVIARNGSGASGAGQECADFSAMAEERGLPNPLEAQGARFTVFDASGAPVRQNRINQSGSHRGLDAGFGMTIDLGQPAPVVSLTLVLFSSPVSLQALDADGKTLATAQVGAGGDSAQTVVLQAPQAQAGSIARVVMAAPGNETLLLRACFGGGPVGYQAGIAALFVLGGVDTGDQKGSDSLVQARTGGPALVVRDNSVSCPRGQALLAFGIGAMSITANTLESGGRYVQPPLLGENPGLNALAQIAQTVNIVNLGGQAAAGGVFAGFGVAVNPHFERVAAVQQSFPNGQVLFHGNQVRLETVGAQGLRPELGLAPQQPSQFVVSTLIASRDDVSVADNQIAALVAQAPVLANLAALGHTVRVSNNRLAEIPNQALLSCWSQGALLNNTSANQTTHCILAQGGNVVQRDNQILVSTLCERFSQFK